MKNGPPCNLLVVVLGDVGEVTEVEVQLAGKTQELVGPHHPLASQRVSESHVLDIGSPSQFGNGDTRTLNAPRYYFVRFHPASSLFKRYVLTWLNYYTFRFKSKYDF